MNATPETTPENDLIIIGKPDLTQQERHELMSVSPDWCHIGYRSHAEIKACPVLPSPVLILDGHQRINDLLVANNRLVFVIMDKTGIIWQLQNYEGHAHAVAVSPDSSTVLGGHYIRTVPELVSILLEGW